MIKQSTFSARDLQIIAAAPPPDVPPLMIGDRCILNSGSPVMTVVDFDESDVVLSWSVGQYAPEFTSPRACVRRWINVRG